MRIGGFGTENTNSIKQKSNTASKRGINDLHSGDRFKATILDIKRGEVTIKLTDGNVITAKSMVIPEARIGDTMEFAVQSNKDNQILLSMYMPNDGSGAENQQQLKTLMDILFSANIAPSEETISIVKMLMDNGLPVDRNTMQGVIQSLKANPDLDMDTLAFMLKEDIPITAENIEQVNLTVHNENKIKNQIENIAFKIAGIDEPQIKQNVLSIFLPDLIESESTQIAEYAKITSDNIISDLSTQEQKDIFSQAVKFIFDNVVENDETMLKAYNLFKETGNIEVVKDFLNEDYMMHQANEILKDSGNVDNVLNFLNPESQKNLNIFGMVEKNFMSDELNQFLSKLLEFAFETDKMPKAELLGKAIKESLFIDIKNKNTPEELNKYYQQLHDKVVKALSHTQVGSSENTVEASKALTEIKENIEFMNNINKFQEFIQIPFKIGNTENQGELYVFNDKKGKKLSKDRASVLIALDLSMLGHFEAFVQKDFRNISCQFRTMDKKIQSLVQMNINKLHTALKSKGYNLTQIMYKTIDEPFNILKSPEDAGMDLQPQQNNVKRYSFDMRA